MEIVLQFLFAHPYLSVAQTAFMIWMLVDCYRRQAESFWFWVIFFIPVLGAWAYFFAVKVSDFRGINLAGLFQRKASLDELRYRAEAMPTLTNHLALAQRLMELGDHEEAIPHLEEALKKEPDHGSALYFLAGCYKEMGQFDRAEPPLRRLLERDARWSNYVAWYLLIDTCSLAGDRAGALAACRELARLAPTLQNQCLLAEHLLDDGHGDEARALLERVLRDYDYLPGPIRHRNRRWANQARGLQKRVKSA
jgi:hypothetical protein